MAWVQGPTAAVAVATSIAKAFAGSTPSGNLVVVAIAQLNAANPIRAITNVTDDIDGAGDPYLLGKTVEDATPNVRISIYYKVAVAAGTRTVTCAFTGGSSDAAIAINEYDTTYTVLDNTNSNTGTGTAATAGSVTPSANALYVQALSDLNGVTITPDGAWAQRQEIESSGTCPISFIDLATSGAQDPTTTLGSTPGNWSCAVVTFKSAGVAFDAASNSGYQTATSSYTFNRTVTGDNTFLAVDVEILSVPGTSVSSIVDDNGGTNTAMVFIGAQSTVSGAGRVECWGLPNPTAGTKQIQVNLSAAVASAANAVSYTQVAQPVPTEAFNSAQATNVGAADATVSITTVTDNCWVHGACATDDASITANQTTRNNVTGALGSGADEDNNAAKTPAGAVTMSYTGVGALATWAIAGYAIRPYAVPTINTQPANQTVYATQTATFTIAATTSGGTLHYQWKFNGSNVGTDSDTYGRTNCAFADNGGIVTCVVTDDNGSTTSGNALLTVYMTAAVFYIRA